MSQIVEAAALYLYSSENIRKQELNAEMMESEPSVSLASRNMILGGGGGGADLRSGRS